MIHILAFAFCIFIFLEYITAATTEKTLTAEEWIESTDKTQLQRVEYEGGKKKYIVVDLLGDVDARMTRLEIEEIIKIQEEKKVKNGSLHPKSN